MNIDEIKKQLELVKDDCRKSEFIEDQLFWIRQCVFIIAVAMVVFTFNSCHHDMKMERYAEQQLNPTEAK